MADRTTDKQGREQTDVRSRDQERPGRRRFGSSGLPGRRGGQGRADRPHRPRGRGCPAGGGRHRQGGGPRLHRPAHPFRCPAPVGWLRQAGPVPWSDHHRAGQLFPVPRPPAGRAPDEARRHVQPDRGNAPQGLPRGGGLGLGDLCRIHRPHPQRPGDQRGTPGGPQRPAPVGDGRRGHGPDRHGGRDRRDAGGPAGVPGCGGGGPVHQLCGHGRAAAAGAEPPRRPVGSGCPGRGAGRIRSHAADRSGIL